MILVAVEYVKAWEYKLILLSDKFIEELNVIFVFEVISCQAVHERKELLLVFGNWWKRAIHACHYLLGETDEFGAEFLVVDGSGDVAVDQAEDFDVFFEDQSLEERRCVLVKKVGLLKADNDWKISVLSALALRRWNS